MCQSPASQANPTAHRTNNDTTIAPIFTGSQYLSMPATLGRAV